MRSAGPSDRGFAIGEEVHHRVFDHRVWEGVSADVASLVVAACEEVVGVWHLDH